MECWCWVLQPLERFTAEFDARGYDNEVEPLPIEISFDGEGDDRLVMLAMYNQGASEPSFFVNDEALLIRGQITGLGRSRLFNEAKHPG